jgi:hypothetical protein
LDQFLEMSTDRVVDGIIHYGGHTHVVPKPMLRGRRAMCDSPLVGNYGYSHEYEALRVTWILSREVLRLHEILKYIDGDRGNIFSGTIW